MAELSCEGVEDAVICSRLEEGSKASFEEDASRPRLDLLAVHLVDDVVELILMLLQTEAFRHLQGALLMKIR